MQTIFHDLATLLAERQSFVLATVCRRSGSAPRAVGARMAVLTDGSIRGTVGGGLLEAQVLQAAPEVFRTRRAQIKAFRLAGKGFAAGDPEMICGGQAEVLVEFVDGAEAAQGALYQALAAAAESGQPACLITALPASPEAGVGRYLWRPAAPPLAAGAALEAGDTLAELAAAAGRRLPEVVMHAQQALLVEPLVDQGTVYIFGAGHIGQKLAPLAALAGFKTVVLDDRPDYANRDIFETADRVIRLDSFERALTDVTLDANSYVVIVTRGHLNDTTVLAQVLQTPAGYIGMIGSRRKRDMVYQQLREAGFTAHDTARVYSPIGVPIGAETPEEIAVSILAEMIQYRAEHRSARR